MAGINLFIAFAAFFVWFLFYIVAREKAIGFSLKIALALLLAFLIYKMGGVEPAAYVATGMTLALFYHVPLKKPK